MRMSVLIGLMAMAAACQRSAHSPAGLTYTQGWRRSDTSPWTDGLEGALARTLDSWIDESNLGKYYFQGWMRPPIA